MTTQYPLSFPVVIIQTRCRVQFIVRSTVYQRTFEMTEDGQHGTPSLDSAASPGSLNPSAMTIKVFESTREQSPATNTDLKMCTIISIDHLSQHFEDLPQDKIRAIGDQALLVRLGEEKNLPKNLLLVNPMQHYVSDDEEQFDYRQYLIDTELSEKSTDETFGDAQSSEIHVDSEPSTGATKRESNLCPIDEPDVLGPLIDQFYNTLMICLHTNPSREILLYLSGHGLHPENIALVPECIMAHPSRHDLNETKSPNCDDERKYLEVFYRDCHKADISKSLSGFVGGEVYIHQ